MFVKKLLGVGVTLGVISACGDTPTQPEFLDSPLLGAAAGRTVKMVPFKATQRQGPAVASHTCPAGEAAGRFIITKGTGTHLGNHTGEGINCIGMISGTFSSVEATLVAANGDELWLEMDPLDPGQIVVFDLTTGEVASIGGVLFVGGTGRFEGATGRAAVRSAGNLFVPGSTVTTMVGEISSPGSIKWSTP